MGFNLSGGTAWQNLYGNNIPNGDVAIMYYSHLLCKQGGEYQFLAGPVSDYAALWVGFDAPSYWGQSNTPDYPVLWQTKSVQTVATVSCNAGDQVPFRWLFWHGKDWQDFEPSIVSPSGDVIVSATSMNSSFFSFGLQVTIT
ncbi:hypothetical protein ANO11243_071260 [Dothideomycetidae sp. 11243]|nr:hypothetical protein ANO11243_071260 [fungal sp. No.11243]